MSDQLVNAQFKGGSLGDLLGGINGLVSLLSDKEQTTTTSGGTKTTTGTKSQTTKTDLSRETVLGLIDQVLGSNQGLASVTSGQNTAGIYNSTVNTQLVNDLLSRVTTDVAAKAAPTTTTGTDTQVTTSTPTVSKTLTPAAVDPMNALLLTAGGYVGNKLLKKSGVLDVIDETVNSGTDKIAELLGFGGGNVAEGITGTAANAFSDIFASGGMADVAMSGAMADFAPSLSDAVGGFVGDVFGGIGGDFLGSTGILGLDSAFGAFDSSIPVVGPVMDIMSGDVGSAALTVAGSMLGGPVGGLIGGLVGDIFGGGGSVICTEAYKQNLLPAGYYQAEVAALSKAPLSANTARGYHSWAKPIVKWMQKDKRIAKFFAAYATAYIDETVFKKGSLKGKFVTYILLPICTAWGALLNVVSPEVKGVLKWQRM